MKQVYPAFIAEYENDYLVYVPDWDIYTEGKTMADAIEMARDAIGLKGIDYEDDNKEMPIPSTHIEALEMAKADTEIFDYSTGILSMIDIDFAEYRRKYDNKSVRRNVTLPNWLNVEAEKAHINVSRVLQEALMQVLGVSPR